MYLENAEVYKFMLIYSSHPFLKNKHNVNLEYLYILVDNFDNLRNFPIVAFHCPFGKNRKDGW